VLPARRVRRRVVAVLLLGLSFAAGGTEVPERLTVVHSASWTPYAFRDSDGQPSGLMIDLWRLFGERNDVEIAFELVDWRDTFELVRLLLADAIGRFRAEHALYTSGIRVAVTKGADDLLRFIDAGFSRITDAEVEAIHDRWAASEQPLPGWLLTSAIATVVTLCLLGLLAHYIVLQRMVRRRTADLNASLHALEQANRELGRRASTDPLTGIANRHTFYERAAAEIERAKRYGRPLSLALFDLDHFKQINDRFGHLAGDAVLTDFAAAVGAKLRDTDTFARFGGDEFVVLLPETRGAEAVFMVRRILGDLGEHRFQYDGNALSVSFSAGVAEYSGGEAVDDWLQRADSSLYRGKSSGRSIVTTGAGPDAASTFGAGP
jgi:diguanylate cyclase (GGDEF)-like protein